MTGKRRGNTIHRIQADDTKKIIDDLSVHIYCETIECPNRCRCINQGVATFMIMGEICTRRCNSLCVSRLGKPLPLDPCEPENIARAVKQLNLKHVVLTSVTRDDLKDGGASHIALTVTSIHESNPGATVEVILHNSSPDVDAIGTIVGSSPEVVCLDIKTVPRLTHIYENAEYRQSIGFLEKIKMLNPGIVTKSGLMLGLGENDYEVIKVLSDIYDTGCNGITLGQYLPASTRHYQLNRYISPQEFGEYQNLSMQMGYSSVRSGTFVRNSYDALEMYKEVAE